MGSYFDYADKVITFLEYLSPEVVIQRLIGRAKEEHTLFANYSTSWWKIKDSIDAQMEYLDTYQGRKCRLFKRQMREKIFDIKQKNCCNLL